MSMHTSKEASTLAHARMHAGGLDQSVDDRSTCALDCAIHVLLAHARTRVHMHACMHAYNCAGTVYVQ